MSQFPATSCNIEPKTDPDKLRLAEKLSQLAIELATNHCTVSFGEEEKKKVKLSKIFDTNQDIYKLMTSQIKKKVEHGEAYVSDIVQHRNILVIGAGATYDSYKCVPLGMQVIDKFEAKYKSKIDAFPAVKEKFKNHLTELRLQHRDPDFENMLSLYSEMILTSGELRQEISELFNFRYSPSLFYELIAHLFKHSFIDVIINFNFDEILDQAIEEELGSENYYHILSDGDCVPIEDMMVDGRLKIPIYIKPHGSVSHRSTLRFTKRHYLDVPEQIKELLIRLISGERGEVIGKKKEEVGAIEKINVISVGFNMESLEFGDILDQYLPKQSQLYHICYSKDDKRDPFFTSKVLPQFWKRAFDYHIIEENKPWKENDLDEHIYTRICVERFNKTTDNNELTTPFAELFSYLWRKVYHSFRPELTPRSIGRHEIINYLFYDPVFSKVDDKVEPDVIRTELAKRFEENIEYFLDRTIVEIAIAINRNNGIVEIAQLLGDRAGLYYKKYRDLYFKIKKTNKGAHSIYDLINQFGSKELQQSADTNYSKNIFQLDLSVLDTLKKDKALIQLKADGTLNESEVNSIMKRWVIKELVKNDRSRPEIDSNIQPLKLILKKFNAILEGDDPVPIVVLFRLFKVKYLSQTFISNFQKNYDKRIYNGNTYLVDDYKDRKVTLLDEIARLFLKSNRRHYYSIRPRYHDSKNYLTESFSKSRILHTNLSVEYAFRSMFLNENWDIALIISETGSILNFLEDEENANKHFSEKKIIVLNSFDAIKQMHKACDNVRSVNEEQNKKYQVLISTDKLEPKDVVYTFSLPSIQHNHHMMLFIKKIPPGTDISRYENPVYEIRENDKIETVFNMMGAMYIYRQGFSNSVNPLMIGMYPYGNGDEDIPTIRHDFKKLLRIFSTTFYRALAFEGTKKIKNLDINIDKYQKWLPDEEVENINKLVRYFFDLENMKFISDPISKD